MSNWALELQQFDIERIWIRGESNILADAPSRAPWEAALAQFLPIPDMPVRDLVVKMYQDPDGVEELVSRRREQLTPGSEFAPIYDGAQAGRAEPGVKSHEYDTGYPMLDQVEKWGRSTPEFGKKTPDFGKEQAALCSEIVGHFGRGEVLARHLEEWPRFPVCVMKDVISEKIRVGPELKSCLLYTSPSPRD